MKSIIAHTFSIFLIPYLLFHINVSAQEMIEITGKVLREDSLTAIHGAVVYNKNSLLGTLTNKNGNFKMRVKSGDTLQVTHLGFVNYLLVFQSTDFDANEKIRIVMRIRSYELQAIDVRAYRIRERARPKELSLKRTDNITIDIGRIKLDAIPYYGNNGTPGIGLQMPMIGVPIPDFREARRQKQLAIVAELEKKDQLRRYIAYKYNKKQVYKITGLTGNELENFMNYCKPTDKQIIEASEYDMAYLILSCYERFREENE